MRAHMALKYSGLPIELREVLLNNLPDEALAASPDSTVPTLVFDDGHFINESWDIVKWAVQENDPENWAGNNGSLMADAEMLIETNDYSFKADLDHYKYADRFPEQTAEHYRSECEEFLQELEILLSEHDFLLSSQISIADIGIAPFVRQFSMVDSDWFEQSPYPLLKKWLKTLLVTPWFIAALEKHEIWSPDQRPVYI